MKKTTIEPREGLFVIEPSHGDRSLCSLDSERVKHDYKHYGALLFRGFDYSLDDFKAFSDQFCSNYVSNKSPGRNQLSQDGRVQTVNLGERSFALHPEIAREPWQPDVAWFACESPSKLGGETLVCDGVAAVKQFSDDLLDVMASSELSHSLPTDLTWASQFLSLPQLTLSELLNLQHIVGLRFSLINGQLVRTYDRPMLHKPMFLDEWAYGSFLVFARRNLGIRNFPVFKNGAEVSDQWVDEIESVTSRISVTINWRKKDLVMLDNTRFMHGRNPIGDPENRKIITQFGYLSFVPSKYPNLRQQVWRKPI